MEDVSPYEVVFNGEIISGLTTDEARKSLVSTLTMEPLKAASIPFDGSTCVLYRSGSKRLALEASRRFTKAGIKCKVRRRGDRPPASSEGSGFRALDYTLIAFVVILALFVFSHMVGI